MNLHEYQAKQLFSDYGIPVSRGLPANSVDEAVKNAATLGGSGWVVKALINRPEKDTPPCAATCVASSIAAAHRTHARTLNVIRIAVS